MTELYQTAYKSRPPVIDGLLYSGAYILAGAPKIGKSFLVSNGNASDRADIVRRAPV